ncbi:MAG: extracellular solute-binding protein [Clostridiales bacterium]|nr:extracellular solute-binding protein [Clostridiales bacterium]
MKKKLIALLLTGVIVFSLAACGSSSSSSEGDTSAASEEAADDGSESMGSSDDENTLTIAAWDASFNIPALEAAAEVYKANVNPDFVLDLREQSEASDIETAITTAASAGNYDTLTDIVLFQDHYIESYVSDYPDAWLSIDDIDINWDDFQSEKLTYSTIDGVHYGVPMDSGTVICAYRVDLLEECGYTIDDLIGITWDEFTEIGKVVKETTGKYLMCINGDSGDLVYMMLQAEGVSQFQDGAPYITENETLKEIVQTIVDMANEGVLLLTNSWSDYTDTAIQGDQVAGVMNGNWIIPTIEKVEANSGLWEITTMPTLTGAEGYAANGGSALYITANCSNVDLAKDFLAYTFGGGEGAIDTYDVALTDGGVISTYTPAGESDVYNQGVAYFNDTAIYADIVEYGTHVQTIEQNPYHYSCGTQIAAAIVNIINGSDLDAALQDAEDQLNFEMGN